MPTRSITLTAEQNAFIEEAVKSGEYQNASEAVRDALRALQQRRREDALKLEALRQQIDAGLAALEKGEFTEIDDAELDSYLDGFGRATGRARTVTDAALSPLAAGGVGSGEHPGGEPQTRGSGGPAAVCGASCCRDAQNRGRA